MRLTVPMPVIGIVRTSHADPETTPIQAGLSRAEYGTLEIGAPYQEGLDGLPGFDYAWLLTWLDQPAPTDHPAPGETGGPASLPPLRQVPFLLRRQRRQVGIFAARGPRRVNPIGLSLIQILEVAGGRIRFAGVDLLDGTPVVDLKPYVSRFDRPPGEPRCGWFDELAIADGTTPEQLGP